MSAPLDESPQQAAVEELEIALEWARLHPCPADEHPGALGREPTCTTKAWYRWPDRVPAG